ncbi:hypothetical protein TNCV_2740381 [Trichonephila clavipes]|nr:hypothetical protein TNCV_2740381 [Trichonephila clavipes]
MSLKSFDRPNILCIQKLNDTAQFTFRFERVQNKDDCSATKLGSHAHSETIKGNNCLARHGDEQQQQQKKALKRDIIVSWYLPGLATDFLYPNNQRKKLSKTLSLPQLNYVTSYTNTEVSVWIGRGSVSLNDKYDHQICYRWVSVYKVL